MDGGISSLMEFVSLLTMGFYGLCVLDRSGYIGGPLLEVSLWPWSACLRRRFANSCRVVVRYKLRSQRRVC